MVAYASCMFMLEKSIFKPLGLCLVECKIFFECKIFSGENIFGKGKYFQVFGCIPKNALENIF